MVVVATEPQGIVTEGVSMLLREVQSTKAQAADVVCGSKKMVDGPGGGEKHEETVVVEVVRNGYEGWI